VKLPGAGEVAMVLVVLGVGVGLGWAAFRGDAPSTFDFDPPEYLYMDAGRVLTYLPQAVGGLPEDEQESIAQTRTVTVDLKGSSGPSAGASSQQQRSVSRSLTPTTASRLFSLLDRLGDHDQLAQLDLARSAPRTSRRCGRATSCACSTSIS
jgi:hypothetical protein